MDPQFSLTADETSHVAPAVSLSVPSQQLPFVHTKTTVTTDDLEEFTEPVYDQVHQEQVATSVMTENIAEIPVVQEQVIVGTRPDRLVDARGPHGGLERAACPRSEAGPLLAPPVLAGGDGLDESALAFLVQQTLLARDKEEAEAVEAAVLAELEEKVAVAEGRLPVELQREREGGSRISRQSWAMLSRVEQLAVEWYLAKDVLVKRRVKRQKKKKRRRTRRRRSWLVDVISTADTSLRQCAYVFSAMLGSTADTCLRQFTVAFVVGDSAMAGFAGDDALRAVVGKPAARSASWPVWN